MWPRHAYFPRLQGAETRPRLQTFETETLKNSVSRLSRETTALNMINMIIGRRLSIGHMQCIIILNKTKIWVLLNTAKNTRE